MRSAEDHWPPARIRKRISWRFLCWPGRPLSFTDSSAVSLVVRVSCSQGWPLSHPVAKDCLERLLLHPPQDVLWYHRQVPPCLVFRNAKDWMQGTLPPGLQAPARLCVYRGFLHCFLGPLVVERKWHLSMSYSQDRVSQFLCWHVSSDGSHCYRRAGSIISWMGQKKYLSLSLGIMSSCDS